MKQLRFSQENILRFLRSCNVKIENSEISHQLTSAIKWMDLQLNTIFLTISVSSSDEIRNLDFFVKFNTKHLMYLNDFGAFEKKTGRRSNCF